MKLISPRTYALTAAAESTWRPRGNGAPPMVWHPELSVPWPATHRFAMWKFEDLKERCLEEKLATTSEFFRPAALDDSFERAVRRAHDAAYVEAFYADRLEPSLWRRLGFTQRPDHGALVRRTRLEVAGTMLAADLALERGLACHLGGGTHHAHRAYGAGYTALNDLAVTAKRFSDDDDDDEKRVLVVDLDVHQGDGTAEICAADPRIFTFSLHCAQNYPFGFFGTDYLGHDRSDLDVALSAGTGDAAYLDTLRTHLPPLLDDHAPDLCLYDAGVDAAGVDGLGKFDLSEDGLFQRDLFVLEACVQRRVPVATVIGGGYDRDRHRLAHRHAIVLRAATFVWRKYFHTLLNQGIFRPPRRISPRTKRTAGQ